MNSMVMVNKASINGTQAKASNGVMHDTKKVLLFPGFARPSPSPPPSNSKPSSLVTRAKKLSKGDEWLICIAVISRAALPGVPFARAARGKQSRKWTA